MTKKKAQGAPWSACPTRLIGRCYVLANQLSGEARGSPHDDLVRPRGRGDGRHSTAEAMCTNKWLVMRSASAALALNALIETWFSCCTACAVYTVGIDHMKKSDSRNGR